MQEYLKTLVSIFAYRVRPKAISGRRWALIVQLIKIKDSIHLAIRFVSIKVISLQALQYLITATTFISLQKALEYCSSMEKTINRAIL